MPTRQPLGIFPVSDACAIARLRACTEEMGSAGSTDLDSMSTDNKHSNASLREDWYREVAAAGA